MRGYFGIGVEGVSKAMNVGNLFRSAHAFGASFVFTVAATYETLRGAKADTSKTPGHVPFYAFPDIDSMLLPAGCQLIAIELVDDAVELPSFRHPLQAAYVLGRERGEVSPELLARCDHTVKIPTSFCVNLGIAGAIVMYDRVQSLGRFAPRPMRPGGPTEDLAPHAHGGPVFRRAADAYRTDPPEPGYDEE